MAIREEHIPTILVVDDSPVNLRVISEYLRACGFRVIVSQDGETGFKRAAHARPDLIVLDVMMPGIDGFETCRRLKNDERTRNIPVIFMTALTEIEDKLRGFELGAVDYITKPFHEEEVLARIRTHLSIQNLQHQFQQQNEQLRYEISERKKTEEELRFAQSEIIRLEKEALEMQMAGGFAHEMRNALAGNLIVLNAVKDGDYATLCQKDIELLEKLFTLLEPYIPPEQIDTVLEYCSVIDRDQDMLDAVLHAMGQNTSRALAVTSLILEYARLGRTQAGEELVSAQTTLEGIVKEHRAAFAEQKVTLYFSGDVKQAIKANSSQLHSIFNNLVLNARDALLESDETHDRLIAITISEDVEEQIISVTIADNANGISEDNLLHIFEPFFSTKPSTGAGLGLSFALKLVRLYRGDIDVTSKIGKGTTFTVTLPFSPSSK